ncbi:hypothetical protein J4E90_001942 [Alternaria incomplexa]|uniref:uncharacterized protein n=1 Tax=Alternaria incomplexa TaxID=1187928 RepID=UPI00222037F9|nr:uncharacterized protein J4E90_001942 [Alternaria incomplexa]KAI4919805.1 hypothetical protein J4E90_001942 [Alternaria incomplexa]
MAPPQPPREEGPPKDTASAPTSPAQCDQPSETATLETPSVPITTNTAHNTHTTEASIWWPLKAWMRRSASSLRHKQNDNDVWTPDGYVYLVVGNGEIGRHVKILVDTQSTVDAISTSCVSRYPGYTYSASAGVAIGTSITGRENYLSIAEIEIRWRGINNQAQRSSGPYFRQTRIEESTCHVVESDEFDLIIGQPTINRLELLRRKTPILAAFRGVNTSVNIENIHDDQQSAEDKRKKAKEHKKQREKEEKDKKSNK